MELLELARLPRRELERLYAAGAEPDAADLAGSEFRGFNPPTFARALRIEKFVKGFFRAPDAPDVEGYNVWCSQRDWRRRRRNGRDLRHGFYVCRPASGHRKGCLLLDYGASSRNRRVNPERLLRDFLVHPDPDDRNLLLGKAYVAVGRLVPVSFFLLQRDRAPDQSPT